jgi:hypothetical protein
MKTKQKDINDKGITFDQFVDAMSIVSNENIIFRNGSFWMAQHIPRNGQNVNWVKLSDEFVKNNAYRCRYYGDIP